MSIEKFKLCIVACLACAEACETCAENCKGKPGMAQLQIISDKGSVVRKEDRLLINGNEEVVMFFSLRAGIYFIKTMQGKIEIRKRLVVLD